MFAKKNLIELQRWLPTSRFHGGSELYDGAESRKKRKHSIAMITCMTKQAIYLYCIHNHILPKQINSKAEGSKWYSHAIPKHCPKINNSRLLRPSIFQSWPPKLQSCSFTKQPPCGFTVGWFSVLTNSALSSLGQEGLLAHHLHWSSPQWNCSWHWRVNVVAPAEVYHVAETVLRCVKGRGVRG